MARDEEQSATERIAQGASRRGFLAKVGKLILGAAGGGAVLAAGAGSEDAEAFHFCGHIYTTGSCPHPTGLPRVDSRGYPVRASDGAEIDNLGRPVDSEGYALDESGARLLDLEGRPMPPAPRTPICQEAARRFNIQAQSDGSWYRCCGGRVRKLMDCCSTHRQRINGDASLVGYCHEGRRVFCVMYYDTEVPC